MGERWGAPLRAMLGDPLYFRLFTRLSQAEKFGCDDSEIGVEPPRHRFLYGEVCLESIGTGIVSARFSNSDQRLVSRDLKVFEGKVGERIFQYGVRRGSLRP